MAKYRKKPVVIEAVLFDGQQFGEYANFIPSEMCEFALYSMNNTPVLRISTLEGTMRADAGDWIIKGVKGEFYPCKPDIFEVTYEPAEGQG